MERTWDLEPDLLVVAAAPDAPLLIAGGAPEEVVAREEGRFLVGTARRGARDRLGDGGRGRPGDRSDAVRAACGGGPRRG